MSSVIPENPSAVFSIHILIIFTLLVTLLLYLVSWKKPSLKRFSIPIMIILWMISTVFYIYTFFKLSAYIYLVEAILCFILMTIPLQKLQDKLGREKTT